MNQDPSTMNLNDLKSYISNKESEMKDILMQKIKSMDEALTQKTNEINQLQSNYTKVKEAYDLNLLLLEERDSDLANYDSKFDSIDKVLQLKDTEILKGKQDLKDLTNVLRDERAKRTQLDEYSKFNLSKAQSAHKAELKSLNDLNDQLQAQIEFLKATIASMDLSSSQCTTKHKEEVAVLNQTISKLTKDKEGLQLELNRHKDSIEEMKASIAKLTQEINKHIKDKSALENSIKQLELKESEALSSVYLLTQKNKYTMSELEHIKTDLNNKDNKIDIYINQIDQLKNEVFTHKKTIQEKEYEIEKERFNGKLLNDKANDLANTIDKIIKDKSAIDTTLAASVKSYNEHIERLSKENNELKTTIVQLNNKIKELVNVNVTLKDSRDLNNGNNKPQFTQMDDSVVDAVDFFNQKPSEDFSSLRLQLKQKDIEMGRMKEEYNGIVNNMKIIIEEYKNKEQANVDETNQYKQIVFNLEGKVNELEVLYDSEKKKIQSDLEGKVNKLTKENKRLREDKEKLIRMCSQLKIEANNLQNELNVKYETIGYSQQAQAQAQMMMQQQQYEASEPIMIGQGQGEGLFDDGEKEEIKRKTQKIVNRNNMDSDVRDMAKKTINKVINQIPSSNDYNGQEDNDNNDKENKLNGDEDENQKRSPIQNPFNMNNNYDLSDCIQIDKVSPIQIASDKIKLIKRTNKRDIKSN